MTYFSFLLIFLVLPLTILLVITLIDKRQGETTSGGFLNRRAVWIAIGLHVLLAVVYTTPWDNYLVATHVWYYNPKLISGIILGWVPIEEYTFFILETILTGLWWWFLARRLKPTGEFKPKRKIKYVSTAILAVIWLLAVSILTSGWRPGTYLSLILVWALPAIMLQLAFGADILWYYRKPVLLAISSVFLYISVTDSLAISSGTWTIDPAQSTGIFIGALPIEEAVFFLGTAMLICFGMTLFLASVSQARWTTWADRMPRINPRIFTLKRPTEE